MSNDSSEYVLLGDGVDYSEHFVTSQIFNSYEAACNWCKEMAMSLNFEVVISSHKPKRDGRDVAYVKCNRGVKNRPVGQYRDYPPLRGNTKTRFCGCLFKVKVEQFLDFRYIVRLCDGGGYHNHPLIVYPQGHRQMGALTPPMKEKIRDMASSHVKAAKILFGLTEEFPESDPTIRQVYNETAKIRRQTLDGRTPVQQFAHLASEKNYHLHMVSLDGTGALTHAFAAHPVSVQLLRTYPSVILMDSTYKTNRYRMPFFEMVGVTPTNKNFLIAFALMKDETESSYVWVLSMLKNLIGDDGFPRVILTDRELGLLNAVTRIFPSASHFLCTYHIRVDVNKKVYHLTGKNQQLADSFEKGRWKQVMRASSLQEYERAITAMETSWASFPNILDYVRQTWLVYKEKFVKYWTNMATHFGNTTTNRVESQHSSMKSWLGTSRGSIDSIFERADACATVQILGIKKSLADSMDKCGQHRVFPFQHLTWRVTHRCLLYLQDEKRRIEELGVDPTLTCGCVIRSTHGIPCACEIWNAMRQNRPFSPRSIDPFWSTLVIGDGVNYPQAVHDGDDDVTEFQELVHQMSQQDHAHIRECNRFMRNTLQPEQTELREPVVRENVRGRPRGGINSTITECT